MFHVVLGDKTGYEMNCQSSQNINLHNDDKLENLDNFALQTLTLKRTPCQPRPQLKAFQSCLRIKRLNIIMASNVNKILRQKQNIII